MRFFILQVTGDEQSTVSSKFLSLCGCLFLAAGFGVMGAAGGIYVYRQMNETFVPRLAREIALQLESKLLAQKNETAEQANKAPMPPEQNNKKVSITSAAPAALPLYYWDLDRVMSLSKAGKMLTDYAAKYAQVMENNATALRKALKKDDKSPKAEEARAMITQFEKRRSAAENDARAFVRKLAEKELNGAERYSTAYVVENVAVFTKAPISADVTTFLIERLNMVDLNLPALPKVVEWKK